MPNNDNELAELVRELGLISAPSDLDALRSETKARIHEIHPDHKTIDPKARLERLQKVLKKVGKGTTALQTIDPSSSLAEPRPVALAPRETVEHRLETIEGAHRIASARAFLFPKVSLGAVTAVLAWVFFFPQTFANHPFIGPMLKNSHANVVWLAALILLAVAWLLVWWLERAKGHRAEKLLGLTHQRAALETTGKCHPEGFSASQYQDQLYPNHVWYPGWFRRLAKLLLGKDPYYRTPLTYDVQMAEKVTQLALERFVQRGWIARIRRPEGETSVDDWYKVI